MLLPIHITNHSHTSSLLALHRLLPILSPKLLLPLSIFQIDLILHVHHHRQLSMNSPQAPLQHPHPNNFHLPPITNILLPLGQRMLQASLNLNLILFLLPT
jgi:hypothetical protein